MWVCISRLLAGCVHCQIQLSNCLSRSLIEVLCQGNSLLTSLGKIVVFQHPQQLNQKQLKNNQIISKMLFNASFGRVQHPKLSFLYRSCDFHIKPVRRNTSTDLQRLFTSSAKHRDIWGEYSYQLLLSQICPVHRTRFEVWRNLLYPASKLPLSPRAKRDLTPPILPLGLHAKRNPFLMAPNLPFGPQVKTNRS